MKEKLRELLFYYDTKMFDQQQELESAKETFKKDEEKLSYFKVRNLHFFYVV